MPKTPTPFFSTRAPVSRVSEASDKIEPSTGTTPEMVTRAAFTAAASAPEDMTPDMVIYMVKPMSRILNEAKHSHRRKPAAFCKVGFSLISPAAHKMMNSRMAGNTRFFPRESRSPAPISVALEAITECVKTKQGNLLELAVEAAKVRASLGEISDACEVVVGRYKAVIRSISGVYSSEVKNDKSFERAKELCAEFAKKEGRQPRVMIAKLGQDGHDRGAKVVATGYADIGFDVDMGPLFQTPEEAAKQAVENDVHVVGVSSLAAGHLTLVPQIIAELKKLGREDIIVIVGGVIPAQDYDELYRDGAAAIFGPGTPIATAAIKILEILLAE